MHAYSLDMPLIILLMGLVIVVAIGTRIGLKGRRIPPIFVFFTTGFFLRLLDYRLEFLGETGSLVFGFLGHVGVVVLLFRIGLESKTEGLLKQLAPASLVATLGILFSGVAGFLVSRWFLALTWAQSLVVATAFTATSVGVTVAIWREAGALDSELGALIVDTAEIDDIFAIVLLSVLLGVLPHLSTGNGPGMYTLALEALWTLGKLAIFWAVCLLFSWYLEHSMTTWIASRAAPPEPALLVAGVSLMITALAGLAGFSLAMGAFFAGLLFSRDSEAIHLQASFRPLYEVCYPFFFVGIALEIDPAVLRESFTVGGILLVAAVVSKWLSGLAVLHRGTTTALLVGATMIPRAEIALLVAERSRSVISASTFGAIVFVSAGTCLLAPFLVTWLLRCSQVGK